MWAIEGERRRVHRWWAEEVSWLAEARGEGVRRADLRGKGGKDEEGGAEVWEGMGGEEAAGYRPES